MRHPRLLRLLAALVAAVLLTTCATFPVARPAVFGTVRVAFGEPIDSADPWRDDQLVELRRELRSLAALGPAFVETSEGDADVVLRPFDSKLASGDQHACGAGVARYHLGSDYAEIDATCCEGYEELRAAAGHEIGHFIHMAHVCEYDEADATCDSHVGPGVAMMNPSIRYALDTNYETTPAGGNDDTYVAAPDPTNLDVVEFARVRNGRTHYSLPPRGARMTARRRPTRAELGK